jgi:hypothetical protein
LARLMKFFLYLPLFLLRLTHSSLILLQFGPLGERARARERDLKFSSSPCPVKSTYPPSYPSALSTLFPSGFPTPPTSTSPSPSSRCSRPSCPSPSTPSASPSRRPSSQKLWPICSPSRWVSPLLPTTRPNSTPGGLFSNWVPSLSRPQGSS